MIKFVDITFVVDKSLDIFFASMVDEFKNPSEIRYNPKSSNNLAKTIFSDVLEESAELYSKKYDKVLFAVPCFPIMRMSKLSIMSRFICRNIDYLYENGISSSQFQESFEKYLSKICKNEYINQIKDNVFILNGRSVLLKDWKDAVLSRFGSSLVNFDKEYPFDNNPDFIINFESENREFTKFSEEERFKITSIIENLT